MSTVVSEPPARVLAPAEPLTSPAPTPGRAPRPPAGFVRRHRLLLVALVLVLLFHGGLLLAGSYQRTYDAYVHIFFADHYARDWFSSWDDRWYTGFSTFSYPPGGHQLIAAVSHLVGLRMGFVVVQTAALLNLTVGVYRWARIWVDHRSSGWAAILLVLSSSIAETVHVFGQLPTTLSLGFLLQALPFADRWVRHGNRKALLAGVSCVMACTACHHVTTLFGSLFFLGPVLLSGLVAGLRTPRADERTGHPARVSRGLLAPMVARRLRRVLPSATRAGVFGVLVVVALLGVVLPYWLYSKSDPITQVAIPHASRDSFLVNLNAGLVFWLIPWGTTLLVLPYAFLRGLASKAWPLTLSLMLLTLLGTGGTTPLPKLILGGAYNILTLDRFTFWATICVLPLAGHFVDSVTRGSIRRALVAHLGRPLAGVLPVLLVLAHLATTLFAVNLTHYRPFQPASIDVTPITTFLDKDDHTRWRYLTLGFGDQMAWLGANTTAQTVDGDYHSARQLPELTSRPIERLEGAKYSGVPGIGSLQQFLAVPERYCLKYVFSNDDFYSPLLNASGWTDLGPLENGIEVWERADVAPLPVSTEDHQGPRWERLMWGVVPPTSIATALLILLWSALGAPGGLGWARTLSRRRGLGGLRVVGSLARRAVHPLGALPRLVDRRLAAVAARLPDGAGTPPSTGRWLPWRPVVRRVRVRTRRVVGRRRRRRQAAVASALLVAAVLTTGVVLTRPHVATPTQVVADYYDHLDFRRFADAYALLDPQTRPDFVQYQLDLGRDGGLVASFAKLADESGVVTSSTPGRVVVSTTLDYLTALQSYRVTTDVVVVQRQGRWYVDLPPADPTVPPDEFLSRPQVSFLSQGRRAVTSDATSTVDVLDRPELTLGQVRSLVVDGRYLVIGTVTNVDVDPADVTVQAQIRDTAGHLLAGWDAASLLQHKLMPGESSPFRIEFQSIAGTGVYGTEADGGVKDATIGTPGAASTLAVGKVVPQKSSALHGPVEFDPQTITPLVLPPGARVGSMEVSARAVVTSSSTVRGLQVLGVHLTSVGGVLSVAGTLRNDTTVDAAVPHLLLSYLDASGRLAWVDHAYLAHSVGPQSSTGFSIPLADAAGLHPSGVPTSAFAGPSHYAPAPPPPAMLTLPSSTGFAGLGVTATAYDRAGRL